MKTVTIAVALACAAMTSPAFAADAFDVAAVSAGIESRFTRGTVTKERSDEFATVSVTPGDMKWGRYSFTVAVFNRSGKPINIGAENITAQMLDGRTVGTLPATEVVRIGSSRARWAAVGTALANMNSPYSTYSGSSYSSGHGNVGRTGFNYYGSSHSSGRVYDATAAALNRQRTDYQLGQIRAGLDELIANVGENYFSTNTLPDGEGFAGTVLIEKLKFKKAKGEKTLRRNVLITVNVDGRPYSFPFTAPK